MVSNCTYQNRTLMGHVYQWQHQNNARGVAKDGLKLRFWEQGRQERQSGRSRTSNSEVHFSKETRVVKSWSEQSETGFGLDQKKERKRKEMGAQNVNIEWWVKIWYCSGIRNACAHNGITVWLVSSGTWRKKGNKQKGNKWRRNKRELGRFIE